MSFRSTLILNCDAQPKSLIPLSVETWQNVITGVYTGKLRPIHYYENWFVHSPSTTFQVPSVCALSKQVKVKHRFSSEHNGPQNALVFLRDGYVCQYCLGSFTRKELTVDHVIPKSVGGKRTWQNLSSCCESCNFARGTNEKIQPNTKPVRPTYDHLVKQMRKFPIVISHETWKYYLNWDDDKFILKTPSLNYQDEFDFLST